ncbi:acyltransferase family protein [Ralstonia mannitolilytica]|uniref:acyltransferase family protein n=1 Tax=Ralstonia mannitolilytica TaxID=105219 RepID=UPI000C7D5EB2|nr:acyltransferase [Ralstonia mannitolilytica]PLT18751.1 hypothetical protein CXP34_01740 [Ralstonia mannitolilytica]
MLISIAKLRHDTKMKNANDRLHSLDALRGIAALGVAMFWHYNHFFKVDDHTVLPLYGVFGWFYDYAYNLVDFFFVLSGYVFMRTYGEKIASGRVSFAQYAVNRFSRLYPLHLLTLLVVAAQVSWMQIHGTGFIYKENDFIRFILNAFLLQSGWFDASQTFNGPAWSIACEVIVYLLFFAALHRLKRPMAYNVAFLCLLYVGLAIGYRGGEFYILNSNTARALMGFFGGTLLYQATRKMEPGSFGAHIFLLVSALTATYCAFMSHELGFRKFFGSFELSFPLVVYPVIIVLATTNRAIASALSIWPMRVLGNLSFSIYLWHYPIQTFLHFFFERRGTQPGSMHAWLLYFACVLVVASASYYLFERPMQSAIRKRFFRAKPVEAKRKAQEAEPVSA